MGTQLPPKKGHSPTLFSAHVYCGYGRPSQLLMSSCLNGSRRPSWICCVLWTSHEEYSVVFITVQNLVGSNALVLILNEFGLKNAYSGSQNGVLGGLGPLNAERPHCHTQEAPSCVETHHMMYRSFLHSSPFCTTAENHMLYGRPDTPEVHARLVIHVPWTQSTEHHKMHVDRFSRFCTAHG